MGKITNWKDIILISGKTPGGGGGGVGGGAGVLGNSWYQIRNKKA